MNKFLLINKNKISEKVPLEESRFSEFLSKSIGLEIEYDDKKYIITGGNTHDGSYMNKSVVANEYKYIKIGTKRKRVHGCIISEHVHIISIKEI